MSVDRTLCGNCGFVVVGTECPLCEHDIDEKAVSSDAGEAT